MVEGDIESNLSEADYEQHQRDLADYAHTKRYHTERKRGARLYETRSGETPTGIIGDETTKETDNCDASSVIHEDILCDERSE
jgi:hypothetical protein